MRLTQLIRDDDRVSKALRRLKKGELDLNALQSEIMGMHSSRPSRSLRPKRMLQGSATSLVESTTTDMTFRSRCTEIRMLVLTEKLERDGQMRALRKYILTRYADQLRKKYRTVTGQKDFVEVLLESFLTRSAQMEHVLQLATMASEDIDQSGWGLKLIKETLEALGKERYG